MNTDNLILRETDNLPLINKDDTLTSADLDGNFIKIYNDFLALSTANDPTLVFDIDRSYAIGEYATYNGKMWVSTIEVTGVTPDIDSLEWLDIFPTVLAHEKNKDTYLDYGGANATSVAEIRAFIDAGLTSTTNLTLTTKTPTSFKIESSTGSDVIITQATNVDAGLLNAEDKVKLDNTSGINTGDQTLESLSAEDITNKATDFTTINDTLYPTTQAVDTYITAQIPDLVDTFLSTNVELNTNKAIDFTTVNDTLYPSVKAVDDHINSKLAGLWDDRGSYDASTNLFPSTGGSGGSGAIMKGDIWTINVQGTLGGTLMHVGDTVRALTDAPGQTSTNWALLENAIGYVPENVVNKATTFVGNTTSDTKYPSVKAVVDNFDATNIKSILGITVLSGSNTGDQDLSTLLVKSNNLSDLTNTTTARSNLGLGSLATQSGTFSGTSSGTNTGDQIISDATISLTDITTNNFTTSKHGFVPKGTNVGNFLKDDGTWGTPASGSSGGIWGIANSSGVYTYYATWALAVAAATSGKCIELFADITENSVSYTLKNGVNINGNGHSVSFSVVDGFIATSSPTICEINNIVINQATASVNGLYINANGSIIGGNATFNSNNASSYGVYGRSVARIYGFTCNGYNPIASSNFFSPNAVIDNVYVESLGGGVNAGTLSNSIIKTSVAGNVPVGDCGTVNNCYIYSNGGSAIVGTSIMEVNNCTIVSVTSRAVNGNGITFNNCWIKSLANAVQGNGTFNNCTLVASTTPINTYLGGGNFNNCTITANASAVFDSAGSSTIVNNCNIISNYNNASGYAFSGSACYVNNSIIKLANASSTAFYSSGALTMYLANNSIKGTTNFKNANVTNGQTNTADAQGNVILQ